MRAQSVNRLMLLASAPFLGALIWLGFFATFHLTIDSFQPQPKPEVNIAEQTDSIASGLQSAQFQTASISQALEEKMQLYADTTELALSMNQLAAAQTNKPWIIYDYRITALLGTPLNHIYSNNIDLKLFSIKEKAYSGYAMKVHLKTNKAMKMVLGYDKVGKGETTSSAVKRYNAIAGVNAGGFADDLKSGKRYPLSTTVLNGNFVMPFEPSYKDLFFVGLDQNLKLVGGQFESKNSLESLKPLFGASFVPILLEAGAKKTLPQKWKTTPRRAPRTVIGSYKNNRLIVLVIDGRNENGSSGASLEELQNQLANLGVMDAYNLDGGGSSTLVLNNRVLNSPSDGKQRKLPTHFLFFK
jgi:exopolysaccharide biosynthesis protein